MSDALGIHNGAHAARGFGGIVNLGFSNQLAVGNAEGLQVFAPISPSLKRGSPPEPPVVITIGASPRWKSWGRGPAALCTLEKDGRHIQPRQKPNAPAAGTRHAPNVVNFANNSLLHSRPALAPKATTAISSNARCHADQPKRNRGTQPDRFQELRLAQNSDMPGSLILIIVEATSRGLGPPSTIRLMLMPSVCALLRGGAFAGPLMLRVAVIGTPAARITPTAMRDAGMRSATLPVLAVLSAAAAKMLSR